jgi:hypothetical protein
MGAASYREDIYLRFLESTDHNTAFTPPGPPDEICPFCAEHFRDQKSLIEHLSAAHRADRPILLLYGREPDRRCYIRHRLPAERILLQNCTSARLRVNGREPVDIPSNQVSRLLSSDDDSIVELELENRFDASAEPMRQFYQLTILVPGKQALDDV